MPACDHCGTVVPKVHQNNNGRTVLRLCNMCQAEFELKQSDSLRPQDFRTQEPWWKRLWKKLGG